MRSLVQLPAGLRMFPQFLRDAGYYCTNNNKEDYNLEKPGRVWDESSKKAHWKNRRKGQPFFAVFNFTISHESQIRNEIDAADQIHDPAKVRLPAYHPDTPEVRRDWAQYYDRITMMDKQAGAKLQELEASRAGGRHDHLLLRRPWLGDAAEQAVGVQLGAERAVHRVLPAEVAALAPKDYRAGGTSDRLVSFVDLAPTMLSLAGIEPPEWMQGGAFCGKYAAPEPEFSFGFRGRMDERYDLVRSVRDKRYMYVRNFMPHRPHGQHNAYMFETPTTRVWRQLFDEGKLNAAQSRFWQQPKEARGAVRSRRPTVMKLLIWPARPSIAMNLSGCERHCGIGSIGSRTSAFFPNGKCTSVRRARRRTTWGTTRKGMISTPCSPPPTWRRH